MEHKSPLEELEALQKLKVRPERFDELLEIVGITEFNRDLCNVEFFEGLNKKQLLAFHHILHILELWRVEKK